MIFEKPNFTPSTLIYYLIRYQILTKVRLSCLDISIPWQPLFLIEYSNKYSRLLFSRRDTSIGILFWKDEFYIKAALNIKFPQSKIDTIRQIIATIKGN